MLFGQAQLLISSSTRVEQTTHWRSPQPGLLPEELPSCSRLLLPGRPSSAPANVCGLGVKIVLTCCCLEGQPASHVCRLAEAEPALFSNRSNRMSSQVMLVRATHRGPDWTSPESSRGAVPLDQNFVGVPAFDGIEGVEAEIVDEQQVTIVPSNARVAQVDRTLAIRRGPCSLFHIDVAHKRVGHPRDELRGFADHARIVLPFCDARAPGQGPPRTAECRVNQDRCLRSREC